MTHPLSSFSNVVLLASGWNIVPEKLDAGLLGMYYTVLWIDPKIQRIDLEVNSKSGHGQSAVD